MNCQGCGQENLADSRFCRACGTPLPLECAGCGRALAADARFCDSCGRPVAEAEPIASSPPLPERAPEPSGDLPTCFDGGRYQIRKFLGEGGKKQVYLAHDTTLDREIDYVEQKGQGCHQADHCRDHAVVSDVLPPGAAAFVTPPARTNATR